jgi:flavodoxin
MGIEEIMMKKAVIIYESKTGNTEKVALAIKNGLEEAGLEVILTKVDNASAIDFFDYDLVCIGSPSYNWRPIKDIADYLTTKFKNYKDQGKIKIGSPKIPDKNALIFCTYSGPHTGINEAVPAGKIIGQFFDHLGFNILDEWYVLSEFRGSEELSTKGRMGDIRGKPTKEDLMNLKRKAKILADKL